MTDAQPHGIVDPTLIKGVLAKAARSYGQILAGSGLVNGVMASSWAWATRPVALAITVIGAVAVLAALLLWGRNNVSTLRDLTGVSRLFLGGTVAAWVVGALVAVVAEASPVWWLLALVLVGLGAWCAWQAYRKADQITAQPTPTGATF